MISIREAVKEDANTIMDFQKSMAWETEKVKLDPGILKMGVEAIFEDPSKGTYYVTESEGVVIGSFLITSEWSDWRNGEILWFQSVYVIPEQRRKNAFRAMYDHIKNQVQNSDKYSGIRLYVDKTNHRAQKVYQNMGMINHHYELFEWMK